MTVHDVLPNDFGEKGKHKLPSGLSIVGPLLPQPSVIAIKKGNSTIWLPDVLGIRFNLS
jgi:hypothetical protein